MADFPKLIAVQDGPPEAVRLRAPLFGTLIERLRACSGRKVILDLGIAQTATVRLFNRFRCRLDIADLATSLALLNSSDEPGLLRQQAETMLPVQSGEDTDIVLCWDLLNYLQLPALSAVMNGVAARARVGTLIHALIVYSSSRMPVRPCIYMPCDDTDGENGRVDQLEIMTTASEECDAPRYTPDNLMRCMPGFRIERAVLLSTGMQEYLFRIP